MNDQYTVYSPSRLNSFNSCPLKYKLSYIDKLTAEEIYSNIDTRKGNAFHLIVEKIVVKIIENFKKINFQDLEEEIKKAKEIYNLNDNEEFNEQKFIDALYLYIDFFNDFLFKKKTEEGYFIFEPEKSLNFDFLNKKDNKIYKFTGKIDLLLSNTSNNEFIIIDYKTSKSIQSSYFEGQMLLYVKALQVLKNIPDEELEKKVKVYLFYPFAQIEGKKEYSYFLKELKYKFLQVEENIQKYIELIQIIEGGNWDPIPIQSPLCAYCIFAGQKQYCDFSIKNGYKPLRGIKIKKKY